MQVGLPFLVGILLAAGIYLLLSRALIRMVLGVVIVSNGIILLIFVAGRLTSSVPPILPSGTSISAAVANPLSQAFILTAIVIGFALFAFLAVLVMRAYQSFDADNSDHMRLSEPAGAPRPPLEY